jgi:hypothetical protein
MVRGRKDVRANSMDDWSTSVARRQDLRAVSIMCPDGPEPIQLPVSVDLVDDQAGFAVDHRDGGRQGRFRRYLYNQMDGWQLDGGAGRHDVAPITDQSSEKSEAALPPLRSGVAPCCQLTAPSPITDSSCAPCGRPSTACRCSSPPVAACNPDLGAGPHSVPAKLFRLCSKFIALN